MLQKACSRVFFGVLLCAFFTVGHAQIFDRLYPDSLSIVLPQPLEWVAVPKDSVASPEAFDTAGSGTAQKRDFQPYTDETILPTSEKQEAWARFALPVTGKLQNWYIRLPGQVIYKVSLYARDAQGNWQFQSAGEAIAPANWNLRTRVPSFELQSHSESPQSYYLRFENRRPITERPMLLTPIEYIDGASRVGVVIGLMLGIFALLTGLCLGAFAMARNKVFLWFGVVVVTLMFTQLVLIGYGGWRIWPHSVHLNQVMGWVSSTVSMAAAAWFCTQASYARDGHPRIHRLLAIVAGVSLLMACVMAVNLDFVPRGLRNLWLTVSTLAILGSLVWIAVRGQAWNLMLLLGAGPIGLAALARLSYNVGWMFNVESAQAAGVMSAMAGLLWVFLVLAWRSRAALFSNHRGAALSTYDPASGLMLPRIVEARLPQMLLRARKQKTECGVLLLHWLNQAPSHDDASGQKRGAALSRIGEILRGAARDVDTVARHDENHFLMLVEGPISRAALSEIATKILADCIRASEKLDESGAFSLHIAIWHNTPGTESAADVMDLLSIRLHHMASGTKRPVQFVGSPLEPDNTAAGDGTRRDDLLAKINAIEISHPTLTGERRDR